MSGDEASLRRRRRVTPVEALKGFDRGMLESSSQCDSEAFHVPAAASAVVRPWMTT